MSVSHRLANDLAGFRTCMQRVTLNLSWLNVVLLHIVANLFASHTKNAVALSSTDLCASKVCSGCIAGSLSCQEGGLTSLPDKLSGDIQSVIFIGHRFDSDELTRQNFSSFSLQTKQMQRLTIRNCGIRHVEPGAFQPLSNLTQLDLSQNRLTRIEAGTFVGLRLELLRLDENKGLTLSTGAFYQTSVVSLSMNHCDLRALTYEDLLPLFQTGALANVHLTGNKLFTLDSRLEPILLGLQSLSLEQNPFLCDCSVKWMVNMLQKRASRRTTRGLQVFGEGFLDDRYSTLGDMDIPLDGDTMKPSCRAPDRLIGKPIEKLNARDFFCEPPRLHMIEIDFTSTSLMPHDASTSEKSKLDVVVRCEVKGSPELRIGWYRKTSTSLISAGVLANAVHSLSKFHPTKLSAPGLAEIRLSRPINFKGDVSPSDPINTAHNHLLEQLVCAASDLNGNTSVDLNLRWPRMAVDSDEELPKNEQEATLFSKVPSAMDYPKGVKKKEEKGSTNPIRGIRPDWYYLTGDDPSGFWLQKQFSAVQMIGAVVGTFAMTLLLFAIGCCLIRSNGLRQRCLRSKYFPRHHSPYIPPSPNSKYSAPPSYSYAPAQLNQTSIHPGQNRTYPDMNQSANSQVPPPTSLTNYHHFENGDLGISTSKRFPYATYEPITVNGHRQSSAYSDSQTYDLPSCTQTAPTPAFPLPPVPLSNLIGPESMSMGLSANGSTPTLYRVNNSNQVMVGMPFGATLGRLPAPCQPPPQMSLSRPSNLLHGTSNSVSQSCMMMNHPGIPTVDTQLTTAENHG